MVSVDSISAIIVAAGKGNRIGTELPKQFLKLCSKPILYYTLEKFSSNPKIDQIILVIAREYLDSPELKAAIPPSINNKSFQIVAGGATRQDSVKNGLDSISDKNGIVLVHDGVRPFVTDQIINENIIECREAGAVLTAFPVADTLKKVDGNYVLNTIDRSNIWKAQTPQTFRFDILEKAFKKAEDQGLEATDEAGLVEGLHRVRLVKGHQNNFKITHKEDLTLARALIKEIKR